MPTTKQLVFTHKDECPHKDFKSDIHPEKVQGDVLVQFPKRVEDFVFFKINDPESFKKHSMPKLFPKITSAQKVLDIKEQISEHKKEEREGLLPIECLNISFTYSGLKILGLRPDELFKKRRDAPDDIFKRGQLEDAGILGDPLAGGIPTDWIPQFKDSHDDIHGVLLVACDSDTTIGKFRTDLNSTGALGAEERRGALVIPVWTLREGSGDFRAPVENAVLGEHTEIIYDLHGDTRSAEENLKDHEHFGWKDGISNPWLEGVFCECRFTNGQWRIPPGTILMGHQGDVDANRVEWAKNGSYMVFRQLEQLVPEFHQWTRDNAIPLNIPGLSPDQLLEKGAALRAAQLVGRWPQGTPLERSELEEKDEYAKDRNEINNFVYKIGDQTKCPFSAHIRKMNPRLSKESANGIDFGEHSIVRAGIAYGKERNESEINGKETLLPRGLAFVSYQSDIPNGFQFQQRRWANEPNFPPTGLEGGRVQFGVSGLDPLIGQGQDDQSRITTDNAGNTLKLARFVVPRGGAYFFVPSMKTLEELSG